MFLGGFGGELEFGSSSHLEHHGDLHGDSTDSSFRLFSLNTIGSFLMMFGWSGLCAYSQFHWSEGGSVAIAFAVGFGAMIVTAVLYSLAFRLASEGANFNPKDAVGLTATVYQRIPAAGIGKIQVTINDQLYELEAKAEDGSEISSFEAVQVHKVLENGMVVVGRLSTTTGESNE